MSEAFVAPTVRAPAANRFGFVRSNLYRFILLLISAILSKLAAGPVTNVDVEKLLAAGIGEEVILNAIAGGEPAFDTSADALIALKQKGASPRVLAAITSSRTASKPIAPQTAPTPIFPSQPSSTNANPITHLNGVLLVDGEKRISMFRSAKDLRMGGKLIPIPGVNAPFSYWSLRGPTSKLRTGNAAPCFVVSLIGNMRAEDSIVLTLWETRANGTREIKVKRTKNVNLNSASISSSAIFPEERIIAVEYKEIDGGASGASRLVEARAKEPLKPGEYALIVSSGEIYDFGIDK
jgi:hypothetical protein